MYIRYTCARAIAERASGIYTLVEELLSDPTKEYMKTTHGIWVVQPAAVEEQTYVDPELERRYQVCLKTFQQHGLNVVSAIDDSRTIKTV